MRRNRVTAPTDLMSELDSDDDDKKLSTQSTVVSSSTAPTQGLSTQKTFVSPAASANKPPNPARTAPKTKVSAKRRQVINAPSSTQSSGNGLFKPLTPAQRKMLETEYYVNKNFYGRDKLYAALKRKHGDPALRTTKDGSIVPARRH